MYSKIKGGSSIISKQQSLIQAINEGEYTYIKELDNSLDVDFYDSYGYTPLHLAILNEKFLFNNEKQLYVIEKILDCENGEKIINKERLNDFDKVTPLVLALRLDEAGENIDIVRLLIKKGAIINKKVNNENPEDLIKDKYKGSLEIQVGNIKLKKRKKTKKRKKLKKKRKNSKKKKLTI